MSCDDECPKSKELYLRRVQCATEHPPHEESPECGRAVTGGKFVPGKPNPTPGFDPETHLKQERSPAMSKVFQDLYGGTPPREPTWPRPIAEAMMERYRNADQETTVYLERHIQRIIVDENIETGIAYTISGLRIYERGDPPRYIIAHLDGGGWLGFLDVVKLINGKGKSDG